MSKIWITSDWHFCHNRDFVYKPRGFNSIHEMNKEIVKRHNAVVGVNDDVYMLGDAMLNDDDTAMSYIKQLNGYIHLIRGNHDTNERMKKYFSCYNIVDACEGKYLDYNGYHFYLSHFPVLTSDMEIDKPLRKRIISLCGHTHTKDPFLDFDKGIIYHCEMDTNNCTPWLLDDIINNIKTKLTD